MTKKTKNIIMFITLIIMIALTITTCVFASKNSNNSTNMQNGMPTMNSNGTPPSMPSENGDDNMQDGVPNLGGENSSSSNNQTPPEKPDGDNFGGGNSQGGMPSNPNGNGGMQDNQNSSGNINMVYYVIFGIESLIISSIVIYLIMSNLNNRGPKETFKSTDKIMIAVLSTILLTAGLTCVDSYVTNKMLTNTNSSQEGQGDLGGMQNSSVSYSAKKEIIEDTDISDEEFTSPNSDENALLINGDIDVILDGITVSKTGDSDGGDNTSFYGNNSAILAKSGASLTIKNATIETNATGANGVFSYGGSATTNNASNDGTTVIISDSKITTTKDNSGGIMTTGGGIMKATNLTINTSGTSSAAIRTDRGGGNVEVTKGTYTTTGQGSPAIYSTADVVVNDAKLISKASEGIVIEGKNSVTINNVDLTDSNTKLNGQSTTYKNIFLYQSMSGDAASGNATFTANDSKITTNNGDSFYVTNTSAIINLTNNTIVNNDSDGSFLRVQKDSWGNSGSNGGEVTLTMTNQKVTGNVVIDSISTLDWKISSSSYFEGTINGENEAKKITLKLDSSSKIKLTGDSFVTNLEDEDSSYSNIDFNGYKLYVNGKAIN